MANVAALMAERLPPSLMDAAKHVAEAARAAGVRPYAVGGAVRDMLMDVPAALDLDLTLLGATPGTFDLIADALGADVTGRSHFTTASLRVGEVNVDLAMTRAEEYPTPGSLPVVRPGTLADDMARRDFSVNAMAVSLNAESWGDLLDLHQGRADLADGRLRVLHSRSFRDDATRILRAARYSARLSLEPTSGTRSAMLDSVRWLSRISAARVRNEMERVFTEGEATTAAMRLLSEWGALAEIHPALRFVERAWERFPAETADLTARDRAGVAYAALCSGVSDADADGIVARLRPDASATRSIRESASLGRTAPGGLSGLSNSELARLLDPLTESAVRGAALTTMGEARRRLAEYLERHRHLRPHLTGDDLIEMGVPRGPDIGRVLSGLRDARLDGAVTTRAEARALAEKVISACPPN